MNMLLAFADGSSVLPPWAIALIVVGALLLILLIFLPIGTYFIALVSKAHVSMSRLIGMKMRRIKYKMLVDVYIRARKAGLNIDITELESHIMAGGNVSNVVNALISAHSANIDLSLQEAKVIETPVISAIAKNGIELRVKARVTVRANISRLIGGAGEETIIARVGEGIVTTVGSSEQHKEVLENPDLISKTVLKKGLDAGTAFEILSIDIADVDVGRNIGAQLQMDQAEADKRIAQANAEERRAMAIATEQEMKAHTQEMRAKVVEAEAEVPKAMAEAFRNGRLGIMDYYQMQNIQADTSMRNAISGNGAESSGKSKK